MLRFFQESWEQPSGGSEGISQERKSLRQQYMEYQVEAAGCGVDSLSFWEMTPREIAAAVKGYNARRKSEIDAQIEMLNMAAWWAGQYNSWAYHNPKRYPRQPYDLERKKKPAMTDNAMESWARAFAKKKK